MKTILLTILTLLISMPVFASQKAAIDIKVNGMVCDFCAQSVWKVFEDYDEVEKVNIDLDKGLVTVFLKPGLSLSDEKLNEAITYAGYDLVSTTRRQTEE